ncbi:glycosyltransferase [Bordetella petrii]|nr:glycosyltransferase [Bordetella petrii]
MRICSEVDRGNAKLYMDYGKGYSEQNVVSLPFSSGDSVCRVVHLKSALRGIRFDPMECAAAFTVDLLHMEPVTAAVARTLMLERLAEWREQEDSAGAGIYPDAVNLAAKGGDEPSENLYSLYEATYHRDPSSTNYAEWIQRNEKSLFGNIAALQEQKRAFLLKPKISIVLPVYNPSLDLLTKAIESVRGQSYENWQLCIADDASPNDAVRSLLREYAERDSRIVVVFRASNGHISAASNSALGLVTGDYVALLDHDDELAEHALHFIVGAINKTPCARVLYTDEDKIDDNGIRSEPHFKSDWNPDLFCSQNYVSHLSVYQHQLLLQIGGFQEGVEGSQDQDLLLRCLPVVQSDEIVHIPMVLYHWRSTAGSTARDAEGKSYTTEAGILALRRYFDSQQRPDILVEKGLAPNTYRVRYPIPAPQPLVSLLIPTRDRVDLLRVCIESIRAKTTYQNYEILILDNESVEPDTLAYFETIHRIDPRVRVVPYHHPFNYSAINNFGASQARGELLGLVNNDIEVISPEWLTEMVSHALRPEIGCVGAKLYFEDDTLQHAGVILGLGGVAGHSHKYFPRAAAGYFHRLQVTQNLSAVTAACLVVRKSVFMEVGGLEEEALRVAFNDVDFCLKVREAGYRNLWTPYAELYHYESKSRGTEDTPEKRARFAKESMYMQQKWADRLRIDPFYSRNLTTSREDFSIA